MADFQIRMTIWSLVNRTCLHINGPKFADRGVGFSPDGSLMALLEVRSSCYIVACPPPVHILSNSNTELSTQL